MTEESKDPEKPPIDAEMTECEKGKDVIEFAKDPRVFARIVDYVSRTVKYDETVKRLIFLAALSAYTDSPVNIFLKGPSSVGKTYNAREVTKLFPKGDVLRLGGVSPTAFIHDHGEYDEEKDVHTVDLSKRIIVFLDSPEPKTLQRLRPILSHDYPEIMYKTTEKRGPGKLKTKTAIIRGWPAAIFCTAVVGYSEQESTRSFLITPDMTPEKYEAAINLLAHQAVTVNSERYDTERTRIEKFLAFLRNIREQYAPTVHVPFIRQLAQKYPHDLPRDIRDFERLRNLIQIVAFMHAAQRKFVKITAGPSIILADEQDYKTARNIFANVIETTRTGLSGNVKDFFENVLIPLAEEVEPESLDRFEATSRPTLSYKQIMNKYYDIYRKPLSNQHLGYYLDPLEQVGWIDRVPDPADKRRNLVEIVETDPARRNWLKTLEIEVSGNTLERYYKNLKEKWKGSPSRIRVYDSILCHLFPLVTFVMNSHRSE